MSTSCFRLGIARSQFTPREFEALGHKAEGYTRRERPLIDNECLEMFLRSEEIVREGTRVGPVGPKSCSVPGVVSVEENMRAEVGEQLYKHFQCTSIVQPCVLSLVGRHLSALAHRHGNAQQRTSSRSPIASRSGTRLCAFDVHLDEMQGTPRCGTQQRSR